MKEEVKGNAHWNQVRGVGVVVEHLHSHGCEDNFYKALVCDFVSKVGGSHGFWVKSLIDLHKCERVFTTRMQNGMSVKKHCICCWPTRAFLHILILGLGRHIMLTCCNNNYKLEQPEDYVHIYYKWDAYQACYGKKIANKNINHSKIGRQNVRIKCSGCQ